MQYYTLKVLVFNRKVGYNTVITLGVLRALPGKLAALVTKLDSEKNKIVLKYIQFWDILRLLFCENIVR